MKKVLSIVLLVAVIFTVSCAHKQQTSLATDYTSQAKRDLLRDRINACWQTLSNGDYESAYSFFDPFFRGRTPLKSYLTNSGRIIYYQYGILDTKVEGNVAKVAMKVSYSLPKVKAKSGAEFEKPMTETTMTETWVYVYDNWYKEFFDPMSETVHTKY
jgi:hypothetical protein